MLNRAARGCLAADPNCRLDNAKQASRLRLEFEGQARAIQAKYEAQLAALQRAAEAHYATGRPGTRCAVFGVVARARNWDKVGPGWTYKLCMSGGCRQRLVRAAGPVTGWRTCYLGSERAPGISPLLRAAGVGTHVLSLLSPVPHCATLVYRVLYRRQTSLSWRKRRMRTLRT